MRIKLLIGLIILLILVSGCSKEIIEESEEIKQCNLGGGEWKSFSNGCVDLCFTQEQLKSGTRECTQAFTDGCDCGLDKCWNGEKCVENPKEDIINNNLSIETEGAIRKLTEEFEKNPNVDLNKEIKELPNIRIFGPDYIIDGLYIHKPVLDLLNYNQFVNVEVVFKDGINNIQKERIINNLDNSEFQIKRITSGFDGNISKKGLIKLLNESAILSIHIYSLSHTQ